MSSHVTYEQVEKLRVQAKASGSPAKIAEWKTASSQYDAMKKELFNDDNPYTTAPSQSYLERLEKKALSGDDADIIRLQMMKERYDLNKKSASGEPARAMKTSIYELRQKVTNGEKLTKKDLQLAGELCVQNASTDNMVLYATIKRNVSE